MRKQEVLDMLSEFPDDLDTEELMYRLYLKAKLERAEAAAQEGKVIPHDEVVRRTSQWGK